METVNTAKATFRNCLDNMQPERAKHLLAHPNDVQAFRVPDFIRHSTRILDAMTGTVVNKLKSINAAKRYSRRMQQLGDIVWVRHTK